MANPQREDGHVDIANEIVEVLAKTQLSGHESRVLWALWRKTWGWVKKDEKGKTMRNRKGQPLKLKSAVMSSKCWEKLTGLNKYDVSRTLRELYLRQIVIKFDNKNRWGVQKDYDKWLQPIKKIVIKNDNTYFVTKNDNAFSKIDNTFSKIDNEMFRKLKGDKSLLTSKETLKETLKDNDVQKKLNEIHFDYNKGSFTGITEEYKSELRKQYPNCNINKQFKRMADWLLDNPNKKRQGKRTFINNWFEKANSNYKERGDMPLLTEHLGKEE